MSEEECPQMGLYSPCTTTVFLFYQHKRKSLMTNIRTTKYPLLIDSTFALQNLGAYFLRLILTNEIRKRNTQTQNVCYNISP